jgi:acyl-coenzyme A synthetase/AMP-(fatty) acid ligase
MQSVERPSLWNALQASNLSGRFIHSRGASVALTELLQGSPLGVDSACAARRSILILTRRQLTAALALIAFDGIAKRMTICPPDLPVSEIAGICEKAEASAIVTDHDSRFPAASSVEVLWWEQGAGPSRSVRETICGTEWVLFTSGTTGGPKLAAHSLKALTGAIEPTAGSWEPHVWATFYDIRRYGGMQIFLRAMLGNASLVLSEPGEPVSEHLSRLANHSVTHISGTPSHWRRVLMSRDPGIFLPRVIRLSGEIADQALLDRLKAMYPAAKIGHAYASTEAGVCFEVGDGLEGFPASLMEPGPGVEMKVEDGHLLVRSNRTAHRYLGEGGHSLLREDGFVGTEDIVERRGGRYYFAGRKDGVINVGGSNVHPEEVEAIINRHPLVQMSLVKSQKSPITGRLVVADVVLNSTGREALPPEECAALQAEILAACLDQLPRHKVPAFLRFVPSLDLTGGGKMSRRNA